MHKYTAVISSVATEYLSNLEKHFDVLTLPPDESLQTPVRCHADMLLFSLGDTLVLPRSYARKYPHIPQILSERCGMYVVLSDARRESTYPYDISLNTLVCGEVAFSLKRYTAEEVADLLASVGIRHENIRQGYAACSAVSLGTGVITADRSVLDACSQHGVDVLEISKGSIRLEGYNEGFIGGASGVCETTVYFLGNIEQHPDGEKIREFLKTHGFNWVCLGTGPLEDLGGIKFFENV